MVVSGLLQKGMWRIKMKSKLKAVQILEVMLGKDLNDRKVLDRSEGAVYNGEERLHIDEALAELNEFTKDSLTYRKDLSRLKVIFNGEISRCGNCGELKRRGFGCYCEDEDE